MKIIKIRYRLVFLSFATLLFLPSCSKGKSYSELLREEERAVNWFLASQKVQPEIPADSIFIEGNDAPFYKLDEDGYLYMQVVNYGDTTNMIKNGDLVYFIYLRKNIKYLYEGFELSWEGNANNMGTNSTATNFVYGNYQLSSTATYGLGIQIPLQYVGNNSEVNLVLSSYYGFSEDQSECMPYLINLKYFKAQY